MVSLPYTGEQLLQHAQLTSVISYTDRKRKSKVKIVYVIKTLGLYSQLSFITYSSINNIYHVLFIFLVLIYLIPGTLYVWTTFHPMPNLSSHCCPTSPPLKPQTPSFLSLFVCVCVCFVQILCVNEIILYLFFSLICFFLA